MPFVGYSQNFVCVEKVEDYAHLYWEHKIRYFLYVSVPIKIKISNIFNSVEISLALLDLRMDIKHVQRWARQYN